MKVFSFVLRSALFCGILLFAAPLIASAGPADDALAKSVEQKLMQGGTNFDATNIIVNSDNGAVNLRGEVKSEKEKRMIEDAAKMVPGVKSVTSEIDVMKN